MIICHTSREFFIYFNYNDDRFTSLLQVSHLLGLYLHHLKRYCQSGCERDETFFKCVNHAQLANWLEHYAEVLELNVWTSSTTTSVSQDPNTNKWYISVKRGEDGNNERKFIVNHLIFATGLGGPKTPIYPGMVSSAINNYKMIQYY
jgi:hypothetical protein